jgi:16S rRNA (guanine966-N2)-methyltransferase
MLGEAVVEARVLDLFAGSGAYGLEALSRGAASAVFVEQNAKACAVINENLLRSGLKGGSVVKGEAFGALRRWSGRDEAPFDLIFADPPYAKKKGDVDYGVQLLESSDLRRLLAPQGFLLLESMVTKATGLAMPTWTVLRDRAYGSTRVLLLQPTATTLPHAETPGAADLQPPLSAGAGGDAAGRATQDEEARRQME